MYIDYYRYTSACRIARDKVKTAGHTNYKLLVHKTASTAIARKNGKIK